MKYVKLFEAFVNEGKVNVTDFADMFAETMANIEEDYDYEEELSTENLLYMLVSAYREVAVQNNMREYREDLRFAFENFKIKTDGKFMNANLDEEAEYFGSQAYGNTDYHLEGMADCFCHVLEEFGLVKKPVVKKIREYLLEEVDEKSSLVAQK